MIPMRRMSVLGDLSAALIAGRPFGPSFPRAVAAASRQRALSLDKKGEMDLDAREKQLPKRFGGFGLFFKNAAVKISMCFEDGGIERPPLRAEGGSDLFLTLSQRQPFGG